MRNIKLKQRTYSGVPTSEKTNREYEHFNLIRDITPEGFVLLKNENLLPLKATDSVFLAGQGAIHQIKGGTGSGDVNERNVVNILDGLCNANMHITNEMDVRAAIEDFDDARLDFRNRVLNVSDHLSAGSDMNVFMYFINNPQRKSKDIILDQKQVQASDAVIYVISRISGEGSDRHLTQGDYLLSNQEKEELNQLSKWSDRIIVLLNVGGVIDLSDILENKSIKTILNISQPGMALGDAVADVLLGKKTPSGKLTTTWGKNYNDYPNAAHFSYLDEQKNGKRYDEYYNEGIYVGYRYFESYGIEPAFAFGHGLSYTTFEWNVEKIEIENNDVSVSVKVKNIGTTYAGKEVVQVYGACPQGRLKKEYKRLLGFAKTKALIPGEEQIINIKIDPMSFASFDDTMAAWILEQGDYGIFVGNASNHCSIEGVLKVEEEITLEKVHHVLPLRDTLEEMEAPIERLELLEKSWKKEVQLKSIKPIIYAPQYREQHFLEHTELDEISEKIANQLSDEELVAILMGEITKGQDNLKENQLVETGIYVPGAAGETTCILEDKYHVPAISMADGPAGLRVLRSYDVDRASGKIYSVGLLSALEGGLFAKDYVRENVDTYYQYATAIPVGTHLAQTFNVDLVTEVGKMVGKEMLEFGISWWLAPGLNIHRNPLCGRNFEYYSEDPFVSGVMAAAMTNGVQSHAGIGTTIKHYACNNQEDHRMDSNSIVSERALREIYLRGFEIAVKKAQPMCIMTSYNMVNQEYIANSYDLCTTVARKEWGFKGIFMTDWTTTTAGSVVPYKCALAGNDLIMPGDQRDVDNIMENLQSGALPREDARACAARMIKILLQTARVE